MSTNGLSMYPHGFPPPTPLPDHFNPPTLLLTPSPLHIRADERSYLAIRRVRICRPFSSFSFPSLIVWTTLRPCRITCFLFQMWAFFNEGDEYGLGLYGFVRPICSKSITAFCKSKFSTKFLNLMVRIRSTSVKLIASVVWFQTLQRKLLSEQGK